MGREAGDAVEKGGCKREGGAAADRVTHHEVPCAANLARKRPRAHPRAGNEARRFIRARVVSSASGPYKKSVDLPYRC